MPGFLRVDVERGPLCESRHVIGAVVADVHGHVLASTSDDDLMAFWRSSAKPFQSLPLVEAATLKSLPLTAKDIGIMCASHAAEPGHIAQVQHLLKAFDVPESALQCGAHPPMHRETAQDMARRGEAPSPIHCNCSGKHAGMLAYAQVIGASLNDYLDPFHPVQQDIFAVIQKVTDLPSSAIAIGTDGCGAPVFGLKLSAMATAFARLAGSDAWLASHQVAEAQAVAPLAQALAQAADAMQRHPFLVSGTGRICTRLMEVLGPHVVAKGGAEGVYCVGLPRMGLGVALKVKDGAARATEPAITAILDALIDFSDDQRHALASFLQPQVLNNAGKPVGKIKAVLSDSFRTSLEALGRDRRG